MQLGAGWRACKAVEFAPSVFDRLDGRRDGVPRVARGDEIVGTDGDHGALALDLAAQISSIVAPPISTAPAPSAPRMSLPSMRLR